MRGTKSAKLLRRSHEASSRKTPAISTNVGNATARWSGETTPSVAKAPSSKAAEAFVGPAERLAEPVKIGAIRAATPQPMRPHQTGRPAFMAKAMDIGKASSATFRPAMRSALKAGPSIWGTAARIGSNCGRGRAASVRQPWTSRERKFWRPRSTAQLLSTRLGLQPISANFSRTLRGRAGV